MGDQELGANSASESANAEVAKGQVTDTHLESDMSSPTSLVKIYLGGLPPELDEEGLKSMLNDKNLPGAESVLVKRGGYAFLEFLDQAKADEVIALMDGLDMQGNTLKAEMSVGSEKRSGPTTFKVIVSNIPIEAEKDELEVLIKEFDTMEIANSGESQTVTVTYQTKEHADKAVNELHETEFKGQTLQARVTERKSPRRMAGTSSGNINVQRNIDFPLRILVQSDMVGAIIGRGGQTIRQITQQTRARVDVHRKDSVGSVEKAITIYGQPENCSNACLQILKVMQEEARNTDKSDDIPLKILAHNNLIGRIIGKQGSTIKRIMEETDSKITVSSINDINSFNMERIITIRGDPEKICKAEAEISVKLRQAFESDLNSLPAQNVMFPNLHPAAMVTPMGMGLAAFNPNAVPMQPHLRVPGPGSFLSGGGGGYYPAAFNGVQVPGGSPGGAKTNSATQMSSIPNNQHGGGNYHHPHHGHHPHHHGHPEAHMASSAGGPHHMGGGGPHGHPAGGATGTSETTHMYIPNGAVGAVIGAKGSYIRDLNKYSGYSIKIATANEEPNEYPAAVNPSDRRVTIMGPQDRFWVPQYLIYEKLKMEGFTDPHDGDVVLNVEMFVPSSHVGRIIGKGGANVRELQRLTGAMIKLPEQLSPPPKDETSVVLIGKWIQILTAQQRLRSMLMQTLNTTNGGSTTTTRVNGTGNPIQVAAKSSGED